LATKVDHEGPEDNGDFLITSKGAHPLHKLEKNLLGCILLFGVIRIIILLILRPDKRHLLIIDLSFKMTKIKGNIKQNFGLIKYFHNKQCISLREREVIIELFGKDGKIIIP
jgi:hypothetical protein